MYLDGHIHIMDEEQSDWNSFDMACKTANISGGIAISLPPASFKPKSCQNDDNFSMRIDQILSLTSSLPSFFPFLWLDPIAENAIEQIDEACGKNIRGFKVICDRFYPYDERAMKAFAHIAAKGLPILFHSGILWDGKPSGIYNRPVGFECLLEIDRIKFSLAHISWPWCDELLAVYGKFQSSHSRWPEISAEMFVDITPGTPKIYRKEALTKLFKIGYDVENNVIFGSDGKVENYRPDWTSGWIEVDNEIYKELELSDDIVNKIYSKNLLRFVGESKEDVSRKTIFSGQ
jgi:predicted TIM-barrel fold metal-dependent hydrolase